MKKPAPRGPLQTLLEYSAFGYSLGRGVHYIAQMRALQLLVHALPGKLPEPMPAEAIEAAHQEFIALLHQDARNIADHLYPASVLEPENPFTHARRLPKLLWDAVQIHRRRTQGRTASFSPEARSRAEELPRYYRRNFHFQTDGYLSDRSAELYEHQVELLFSGAADAMRRMIIEELRTRFGGGDGRGLRFLELGAGTGRASRFIKLAFPRASLTIVDLSDPYLTLARERLSGIEGVDFVRADAAKLPFRKGQFHAVVSVFLFHELPLAIRRKVLLESRRVARPDGFVAAVDSLQMNENPALNPMLAQFPEDFHEPFYRNYTEHPLEELFREAGLADVERRTRFLAKSIRGKVI